MQLQLLYVNKINKTAYCTLGNFRGFRSTARHPRKLNPRKSYMTLYVQRYAQESFQRTKKQEYQTFRILYRSFSRPLCRSSHSLPPSDAPYLTKIWYAAGEDQLQQFALVLITVPRTNNHTNKQSSHFSGHNLYRITYC